MFSKLSRQHDAVGQTWTLKSDRLKRVQVQLSIGDKVHSSEASLLIYEMEKMVSLWGMFWKLSGIMHLKWLLGGTRWGLPNRPGDSACWLTLMYVFCQLSFAECLPWSSGFPSLCEEHQEAEDMADIACRGGISSKLWCQWLCRFWLNIPKGPPPTPYLQASLHRF